MPPPSRLRGAGEHGGGGARRVGVLAARLQATSRCRRARATVMLLCRGRLRLTGWQASPRFTHALAVHAGPNQLKEVTSGAGSGRSRRTHPPAAKKNRRCATRRAVDIRCTTHHSITYHHHHHHLLTLFFGFHTVAGLPTVPRPPPPDRRVVAREGAPTAANSLLEKLVLLDCVASSEKGA